MKVSEIMTPDVEIAAPDDSVQTAAAPVLDYGAGVLPVCESGRLVGMITDRDITVRAAAEDKSPSGCAVCEVMTGQVNYAFAEDDVEAARTMTEWQVHRLPLLNRDKDLVGTSRSATLRSKAETQKAPLQLYVGSPDRAQGTSSRRIVLPRKPGN